MSIVKLIFKFVLIATLVVVSACVPETANKARSAKVSQGSTGGDSSGQPSSDVNDQNDPNFSNSSNFFQDGSVISTNNFNININTTNSFYLRGRQINDYLKIGNRKNEVLCLVERFETFPNTYELLVLAAVPRSFTNFSSNTVENYFLIDPNNLITNQTLCQQTGLINSLSITYPGDNIRFKFTDICPTCNNNQFSSSFSSLFSTSGTQINDINIDYIVTILTNQPEPDDNATACSDSDSCQALGFDCCLAGQCVTDRSVKSSTDTTSTEFLQSQSDIASNPANIFNYPNLYNICPVVVIPGSTPTPDPDPQDELLLRLEEKRELYNCINPSIGEMSICTTNYESLTDGVYDTNGYVFTTGNDDLNFNDTYSGLTNGIPRYSIDKITYGGVILFSNDTFQRSDFSINGIQSPTPTSNINGNNNFSDPMEVKIFDSFILPPSASGSKVKISYKTNGSCERINSQLAKCKKIYVQGQNLGRVTDHFPASNDFMVPLYADTSKVIRVTVDDTLKFSGTHYSIIPASPAIVRFNGSSLAVYDTQTVELTFYVDLNLYDVLQNVEASRDRIREMCQCVGEDCNLTPVTDGAGVIIDYNCFYPQPVGSTAPLQQTFYMSSKTVPLRYFDETGVPHAELDTNTPPSEGVAFEYINNQKDNPNNVSDYIGFSEIYGTMDGSNPLAPKPAKEVGVVKGKTYDIFVDQGIFSSCYFCGNDYWNTVLRLFPRNFTYKGAGFAPNFFETNPRASTTHKKDDLIFGRACFVPASMIPWSHKGQSDRQIQRLNRYNTQHFLFANGYQRDWYGFDYGSIIGSWDGLTWFSVGNQRRIRARSNKLFLAVNSYWGDLTDENTFTITVSDATSVPGSGSAVASDFQSDGAECQQYHVCQSDADCVTQLGWDYACESVTSLKTLWPAIDDNGLEIPDSEELKTLVSIIGNFSGPSKRCIYRGRGTPCDPNYETTNPADNFNRSDKYRHLACSTNNYCQQFVSGSKEAEFNTKIARWGRSVAYQNISPNVTESDLDTFGLHARSIGRPMNYNGQEEITDVILTNASNNNLTAICVPGRQPNQDVRTMNQTKPTDDRYYGDRSLNIGMTFATGTMDDSFFDACPTFNTSGDLINFEQLVDSSSADTFDYSDAISDGLQVRTLATMQNTSTSGLVDILNEAVTEGAINNSLNIIKDFDSEQILQPAYEENRCLRMPGSICHTDLDCAASEFVTDITQLIADNDVDNVVNNYELDFWQETLICSQEKDISDPTYSVKDNRCCMDLDQEMTIPTYNAGSNFSPTIPGRTNQIGATNRYSRFNIVRDILEQNSGYNTNVIAGPTDNQCGSGIGSCMDVADTSQQHKVFPFIPERTCCNKHWVREFDQSNGGGHEWRANRFQTSIDIESFKCFNWIDYDSQPDIIGDPGNKNSPFLCDQSENPGDLDCGIRSVPAQQAEDVNTWLGKLELTGVPQVKIEKSWYTNGAETDVANTINPNLACNVRTDDQTGANSSSEYKLEDTFSSAGNTVTDAEYSDGTHVYYSAADMTNFDSTNIKQVFDNEKVVCCIPAGDQGPADGDQNKCCTGYINPGSGLCALRDYVDVSVYFNRYISSAAKGVDENQFDENGFLKSTSTVESLACQQRVCASGKLLRGVLWSNVRVPGKSADGDPQYFVTQFLDSNDDNTDNFSGLVDLWDAGAKWNTHVYCAPDGIDGSAAGLVVTQCPQ